MSVEVEKAPPRHASRQRAARGRLDLTLRPVACLSAAVAAVVAMVCSSLIARSSTSQIVFDLYWVALFLGLGTAAFVGSRTSNAHVRVSILVAFAVFTYIPKFLMSISGPIYFDEYGQFRHVNDVLASGSLFAPNTYQPIISRFPGLSAGTIAIHAVTGLSVWHSGQLVILLAHGAALPIVAAIARSVGASPRSAFLAALLYGLNPSFAFFDAQFSYESLGLPIAFLAILACLRSSVGGAVPRPGSGTSHRRASPRAWTAVGVAALAACVVTHHLSSLFADATCVVIAVSLSVGLRTRHTPYRPARAWLVAGFGVAATALWFTFVASSLGSYLAPHFSSALDELLQIVGVRPRPKTSGGLPAQRTLFAGSQLPSYEKLAAIATPFLALLLVAGSVLVIWRTRRRRPLATAAVVPFVVIAVAYFASLPFSLTTAGSEISHRSWGYSYLGIAVVAAVAGSRLDHVRVSPRVARWSLVTAAAMVVPLAVGNVALGVNVSYRFPGPYEFGTDTRSDTAALTAVVTWLNAHAPPGVGVVTDRFSSEKIEAYTRLDVPAPTQTRPLALYTYPLHPPPQLTAALRQGGFRYFVLDKHILTEKPRLAFYPGATSYLPVNVRALRHLAHAPELRQVFATGHYAVYRIDAG